MDYVQKKHNRNKLIFYCLYSLILKNEDFNLNRINGKFKNKLDNSNIKKQSMLIQDFKREYVNNTSNLLLLELHDKLNKSIVNSEYH